MFEKSAVHYLNGNLSTSTDTILRIRADRVWHTAVETNRESRICTAREKQGENTHTHVVLRVS